MHLKQPSVLDRRPLLDTEPKGRAPATNEPFVEGSPPYYTKEGVHWPNIPAPHGFGCRDEREAIRYFNCEALH
jgi:hypothetical protein